MLGTAISFASALLGGLLGATCMMLYGKNTEYKLRKSNDYLKDRLKHEEKISDDLREELNKRNMFSQTIIRKGASQGGAVQLGLGRTSLEGGEWKDA